jgi:D-glycero-D-manno-heptose 1,7-bisphosphate phosphatase
MKFNCPGFIENKQISNQGDSLAIFDRDGTLIIDNGYTHKIEDFEWNKTGVLYAKNLYEQGYNIYIATNQGGIAKGLFTEAELLEFTMKMFMDSPQHGFKISGVAYCPHHAEGILPHLKTKCTFRKPNPGMLDFIIETAGVKLKDIIYVGNSENDYLAAFSRNLNYVDVNSLKSTGHK